MGRNRRFATGEVVKSADGLGVVVDYYQDKMKRGRYRVQPVSETNFGMAAGRVKWWESYHLEKVDDGGHVRMRLPGIYRKNQAIPDRGCACHCCIHTKMERSEVRSDGTYLRDDE